MRRLGSAMVLVLVIAGCSRAGASGPIDHSGHLGPMTATTAASPDGSYPGRSAEQVLAAATVAAQGATAVRISGATEQAGRTIRYTMTEVPGKGTVGTVSIDGATAQVRRVGSAVYARPTREFLVSLAGALGSSVWAELDGRWLRADEQQAAAAGLGPLSNLGTSAASFDRAVPTDGSLTRVTGKMVDGEKTTGVTFVRGDRRGTVLVSTGPPGYPAQVTTAAGGTVTFSHWNEAVAVDPPGRSLDLADLDLGSLGVNRTAG